MKPWNKAIQRVSPSWQAAGLTWLWVALLHPDVFFRPNSLLLASSRDAVKNIYTLAWQWAHGGAFSAEFAGMGWPFTEHVFYTDGHPLLAWLTGGWLVPHVLPAEWTAGLVHAAIIASWGLAAALLVRILNHYGARGTGVVLASSFIALSHPQVLRWTGHYAMAYTVALPLTWWLQLQWQATPTWKNAGKQVINLLIWLLTHAYLGAIAAAFAGLMSGFHWLANTQRTRRELAQLAVAAVAPLAGYLLLLAVSDTHLFRTDRPFGFWDNVSQWNAAFLPSHGPLGALRKQLGWGLTVWEGWGYLGTGFWVALGMAAVRIVRLRRWTTVNAGGPWIAVAAALVLYGIGVGEPFRTGGEAWLDRAKLFTQFRAIGRFTWAAVWAFPVLAVWWARRDARWMAIVVVCFGLDAFWMQQEARVQMVPMPNGFQAASPQVKRLGELAQTHGALAIHPVPWFQMGSESVGREGTPPAHKRTLEASLHTGLPTTATHLTRMSISESRTLTEWMAPGGSATQLREAIGGWPEGACVLLYACDDPSTWSPDDQRMWRAGEATSDPAVRLLRLDAFFAQAPRPTTRNPAIGIGTASTAALTPRPWKAGALRGNASTDTSSRTPCNRTVPGWAGPWNPAAGSGTGAHMPAVTLFNSEWVCEAEWPDGSRNWLEHVPVAACGEHAGGWTRAAVNVQLQDLPERLYFFAVGFESDGDSIYADAFRVKPLPL